MPDQTLDITDAAELAELLQFLRDWLSSDHDQHTNSLARFVGNHTYNLTQLQHDLDRFTSPARPDAAEHHPPPAAESKPNPPQRSPIQSVWVASFSTVAMASFSSVVGTAAGRGHRPAPSQPHQPLPSH